MVDLAVTSNTTGISPPDPEIPPTAVINQNKWKEKITITNPAVNNIIMHFGAGLQGQLVFLKCTDMLGQVLINETITVDNATMQIPCNNLIPGVYVVSVTNSTGIISQIKLIKN
jgi:hypothetical protein